MQMEITRQIEFCAAHRLFVSDWTDEKNMMIFGMCSNPFYHGHNYTLRVTLRGEVDPQTGMVFNLSDLKKILQDEIVTRFDHRNLNEEVDLFRTCLPSAENIAASVYHLLEPKLKEKLYKVWLQETPNNYVEYYGKK